ncbi:dicarboxylate/amino acid:cation symporter [Maricaulis sp.]|uniref:dicarboxylate/amino acid:cation symporter n=1 Tax=Maricaulis sp. TaxID=1486257 RepID=UPI001B15FB08|nr:dicarboxylate/amino acid:cation symporter [Maricaulis sp.]MBO6766114.1 dicarboxylate/amino acid:cation symporter [Maricaulis sp.]
MSFWFNIVLWKRILLALALGAVAGYFAGDAVEHLRWVGDLFIRLIRMLIIPLVFVTLVSGVTAMSDPKRLGSIGGKAIALYLATTLFAILLGLALAAGLRPGDGIDLSGATPQELSEPMGLTERLLAIVPENPFAAFAQGDLLAVIFFALMTGTGILIGGEKTKALKSAFDAGAETMLNVTGIVMEFAPFGVFALVAWVMGTSGLSAFANLFVLAVTVVAGCLLHIVITHALFVKFLARLPVIPFLGGVREAQLVAFSTSSSSATLPSTLSAAEHNLGIKPAVASSILPLGATVNMDGTALYVAIVAVFAAQAFGIPLELQDYLLIALTTTLVSIGTASVPSASLFLIAAVLQTIGMTPEQIALVVGFILPFDRILDMTRTVTNVTGDLCVATVVGRWEGEIDEEVYRAKPVE